MIDGGDNDGRVAPHAEAEALAGRAALQLYQPGRRPVPLRREYGHGPERAEQVVDAVLAEVRVRQAQLEFCHRWTRTQVLH